MLSDVSDYAEAEQSDRMFLTYQQFYLGESTRSISEIKLYYNTVIVRNCILFEYIIFTNRVPFVLNGICNKTFHEAF